jgi:hypothetical protein
MTAWLDENCGADGWSMTPSGMHGVLNDAVSIYFADATLASAFVARWCASSKLEAAGLGACSTCARMSRRCGSGRGCIGRRKDPTNIADTMAFSSAPILHWRAGSTRPIITI